MFNNLKPYSDYTAANLPWIDRYPSHWTKQRFKSVLKSIDVRSATGEEELLTVSSVYGIVPRASHSVTMFKAASYIGHKLAAPGDLVINSLWAWGRGLGVSRHAGIVSTAYGVYRRRRHNAVHPDFLHIYVRSEPYNWELHERSRGIWISRLQMTDERFLASPFIAPQYEEQEAIVTYIVHAHRRINKVIATKRRLISLLREEASLVREEALTGLRVTGKRIESSIWLGALPEEWQSVRLKWVTEPLAQGWSPQADAQQASDDEWGVVKVGCVNGGRFRPEQNKRLPAEIVPRPELEIKDGDLLVSRANTLSLVGSVALARNPRPKLMLCDKIFRTHVDQSSALPEFIVQALQSRASRAQIESRASGASHSMQNIGQDVLRELVIPLPPIAVQRQIVAEIHAESTRILQAIDLAEREIVLLEEFKSRLTADVVTGQVDVLEIAATLPTIDSAEAFGGGPVAVEDEVDVEEGEVAVSEELEVA